MHRHDSPSSYWKVKANSRAPQLSRRFASGWATERWNRSQIRAPSDTLCRVAPASLPRLGWLFLRIGAVAFGGLGATVAVIERELVERHRLMTMTDVTEALAYTKLLPGSTAVQVVAYLGWRLGGWPASAMVTTCFLLPSGLLMLALAYGYSSLAHLPAVVAVRRGVLAAVVALLLLTMYRLARSTLTTPTAQALSLGAFVVVGLLHISSVWVVIGAGALGMTLLTARR